MCVRVFVAASRAGRDARGTGVSAAEGERDSASVTVGWRGDMPITDPASIMRLPPSGNPTDRRFTGRKWRNTENSRTRARVQVRPSTSGSIGSFVVDDTTPGDRLASIQVKLAALPQGTRHRARLALSLAYEARVKPSPPRQGGFFSARIARDRVTPRLPSTPSGRPSASNVIRPDTSWSSQTSRSTGRTPRASVLNGKQRLLVGRRSQTAEMLGLNGMRTVGARIDSAEFTLEAQVQYIVCHFLTHARARACVRTHPYTI